MNLFSVKNKVALVTGASRGLGQAIAIGLAQAGATVICSSSRKGGTDQTLKAIKKLSGKGLGIAADLSQRKSVEKLYQKAIKKTKRIDILVNNGGTIARHPAVAFPTKEWDKVIEVNLSAAFRLSQLV